ncbi:hypothetical protein BGZ47_002383 [Haplosporangium gracile]|nr:hypothetical protein BGZ47_002383 [Haplosporangium gracile]
MSDSTVKRVKVSKPEKKKAQPTATAATTTTITPLTPEEALIDIPAVKKKKERRVKTEADIAAKQERKRLRKEAELAKSAAANAAKAASGSRKPTAQNKTPKWKQFLKNSSEADNAEQLKDTSYKVKGDDGSGNEDSDSDSDSSDDDKKKSKKRKADKQSTSDSFKKSKQDDAQLLESDAANPGLAYLVEWKKARATWKFQKLRQVWLINHMYDDKQLPDSHWNLFLEYIHDLKGAARNSAIADAKKIVEAPESEDDDEEEKDEAKKTDESEDQEMKDTSIETEETLTIPLTEEERAAEEASKAVKVESKRAAVVKSSRALAALRVLA